MWPQILPIRELRGGPPPSAPPTLSSSGPCAGWPRLWLPPCSSLSVSGCWCRAPRSRPVWLPFSRESSRRLQESLGCFGFDHGLGGAGRDFSGGSDGKSICLQCRRPGFDPWAWKIPWRRKWQPTPVLLPGKSHGWRNLVGYSPWGHKESETTEQLHFHSGGAWRLASPEAGEGDSAAAGLPASCPPGFILLPQPLPELALLSVSSGWHRLASWPPLSS